MSRHEFDPPIDPGLGCRHCGDRIVAVAQIFEGMQISGLREYEWTHEHGDTVCRPTTTARPFDGWDATRAVETVVAARQAAEDDEAALAEARANVAERRASLWRQR